MMNGDTSRIVYVECPQCHELIQLELGDLTFGGEFVKIVYTHGRFGVNPHSLIIDIDKNYIARQVEIADKTFTKIG